MPKVRDSIAEVEADGWVRVRTAGDYRQYKHPTKPGKVTIPGKPGDQLSQGRYAALAVYAGSALARTGHRLRANRRRVTRDTRI